MAKEKEYEEYHVQWEIECGGAQSHKHAAQLALQSIQKPDTEFKGFTVTRYQTGESVFIDLTETDG